MSDSGVSAICGPLVSFDTRYLCLMWRLIEKRQSLRQNQELNAPAQCAKSNDYR